MSTFDDTKEKPLTMGELAKRIAETRQRAFAPRTLSLWVKVGRVRLSDKEVIQMESKQIGGLIYSSLESYDRFIQKLNEEGE